MRYSFYRRNDRFTIQQLWENLQNNEKLRKMCDVYIREKAEQVKYVWRDPEFKDPHNNN
jgi:hypothetical protein